MKIRVLSALLMCMVFSVGVFAQDKTTEKDLLGTWKFTMEHPMGVETGNCVISKESNEIVAAFDNGMKTSALTEKDGVYIATAEAEGFLVYLTFSKDGEKLNCDMDAEVVVLTMVMERVK